MKYFEESEVTLKYNKKNSLPIFRRLIKVFVQRSVKEKMVPGNLVFIS
jgi:hypothetical protein